MKITQQEIAERVGLKPNFFSDIVNERAKCPPKYALLLAPLTGIPIETWIDPDPDGKRKDLWYKYMRENKY
jgi:plasmid maintenance system antidote protein VapI